VVVCQRYTRSESLKVEETLLAELGKQMETTGLTDDEFKQFQDIAKRTWDRAAQRIGVDYFNSLRASMEKVIANQK
jgi:2-polyprenyl-3-methyl-5-hydroxy-6-metoxy-1,4-benzoquinol methylase